MTKCRKALSIFLAVLMLVSILPMSTFADDNVKETFNIIINYQYADGKQAANPYTANIAEGQPFKATVNSPIVVGYEPDQKTVEINIPAVTKDETYYVTYKAALVDYTVKHYQQNVDNDQYTLADTETRQGYTESIVGAALAKSYDGFTALFYDTETKIAADGSTVVEIYYDRNYYMLNLNLDGGFGAEPVYARYGAPIAVETPQKPGYTFAGWEPALPTTMPVGGGTYTAQWTAGEATYLVQYWLENANDDGYSYDTSVQKSAAVGSAVNGSDDKNYTGFHFDHADQNVIVNGDGTSVVNVYYKRNTYTLTFYVNRNDQKTFNNIKYGADTSPWWNQAQTGYVWATSSSGNTYYSFPATMPNSNLTVYGVKRSGTTTINYYEQGTQNKLKDTFTMAGTYGNMTQEDFIDIPGFTYANWDKNRNNYSVYYTRNSYTLDFNNKGTIVDSKKIAYEASLASYYFEPAYPTGLELGAYEFDGWYTDPGCTIAVDWSTATMPYQNTVFYAKWSPVIHTVTTWLTNEMATPVNVGESNVQSIPHREIAVKPDDPTNGNYTFVGWFYMEDGVEKAFNFSMAVTKDLELYAKWSSNVPVAFTIKYELADGTTIADPTVGSALAGATKTFDAKTGTALYEGYQVGYFPETSSHSITMNIDGGNEFTFVYVPMKKVAYTVKYLEKGTNAELHDPKNEETTLNVITETFVVIEGYAPDAYQKQLILSANAEENVLIFWYVKDKIHAPVVINHWTRNIDGADYSKYQSTTDINAVIGQIYTAEPIDIPGFKYIEGNPATGTLTAAGLELNLYYDRYEYPYEFRYVDSVTGAEIAVAKSGMARFEAQVTHTAPDTYTVGNSTYKLADTANKAMTIQIEKSGEAEVNVVTFKYNRVFKVVHVQEGTAVDTEEIEYNGALRGFSLTNKVPKGYLYGGAFTNLECTDVQNFDEEENAMAFTPKAGATYYIWEVDQAYLVPKSLSCWEHTGNSNYVDVMGFFVATPVDREYYSEVGFTVNDDELVARQVTEKYVDSKGNTKILVNDSEPVLYQKVVILRKDGSQGEYTVNEIANLDVGYIACASVDKKYWDKAGDTIEFTPYWITLDGIKVTNATRVCQYEGEGPDVDENGAYSNLHRMVGKVGNDISAPSISTTSITNQIPLNVFESFLGGVVVDSNPVDPVDPEEPIDPVDPEEPDDGTITVTVNDNGSEYELALLPGDISGEIEYLGASGCLFAGWYTDEAYVEPADFTYVTEDITIYAKYVSDAYLQVQYQQKRMSFRGSKATLISAVDSYAYAETGFIINGETIAVSPRDGSRQFYDIRWLFGNGVAKKSPILTTEISASDYSVGDTIEVTPYWITMDGTTVYGTSCTLTVAKTGFKG